MKCVKFIPILAITLLFGSCAIHANFPFFCFKKECVKRSFEGTGIKTTGGSRGIKQNFKMFFFKIKKKTNKNKKRSGNFESLNSRFSFSENDTVIPKEYIKVVFELKNTKHDSLAPKDSLLIKSSVLLLSKEDKNLIHYYLIKNQVKKIKQVIIFQHYEYSASNSNNNKKSIQLKSKKVYNYFLKSGIKKSKLIIH